MLGEYTTDVLPRLMSAATVTVFLTFVCGAFGLFLAVPMGVARLSSRPWQRRLSGAYVFVFRGTPGLVQLFFLYYGVAQLDFVRDSALWLVLKSPWWCAIIALSLNTGAYTTEIVRGALAAVPRGQIDAARALGLRRAYEFWLIRVPLAVRIALPAYGNEIVLLMKATSIVSTITILDLMGEAKLIYTQTFDPFVPMFTAAAIYIALGFAVARAVGAGEIFMFREQAHTRSELSIPKRPAIETGH